MELLRYHWRPGLRAYFCGVRIPVWLADHADELALVGLWLLIAGGAMLGLVLATV